MRRVAKSVGRQSAYWSQRQSGILQASRRGLSTPGIASTDADIIFLAAETPPGASRMAKALRAKGFNQPIVGGDGYDGEPVWQNNPKLYDIYCSTYAYFGVDHPSPLVAKFRNDYMAEYGGVELASFAALGYDTVGLLVAAVKRADSAALEKVLMALSTTQSYQGVTGTISYVDGSRIRLKSVTILEAVGGKRRS